MGLNRKNYPFLPGVYQIVKGTGDAKIIDEEKDNITSYYFPDGFLVKRAQHIPQQKGKYQVD